MSVYELSAILKGPHRGIALWCLQIQLKVMQRLVNMWVIPCWCVLLCLESH